MYQYQSLETSMFVAISIYKMIMIFFHQKPELNYEKLIKHYFNARMREKLFSGSSMRLKNIFI